MPYFLTSEDEKILKGFIDSNANQQAKTRATALLLIDQGETINSTASILSVHPETVKTIKRRYEVRGNRSVLSIICKTGPGRKADTTYAKIIKILFSCVGEGSKKKWTRKRVKERLKKEYDIDISETTISDLLRERQ